MDERYIGRHPRVELQLVNGVNSHSVIGVNQVPETEHPARSMSHSLALGRFNCRAIVFIERIHASGAKAPANWVIFPSERSGVSPLRDTWRDLPFDSNTAAPAYWPDPQEVLPSRPFCAGPLG